MPVPDEAKKVTQCKQYLVMQENERNHQQNGTKHKILLVQYGRAVHSFSGAKRSCIAQIGIAAAYALAWKSYG